MEMKNGDHILFLCDRKACGETCPNESCSHTGDIRHAKNFDAVTVGDIVDYFELEQEAPALDVFVDTKEHIDRAVKMYNSCMNFDPTGDTLGDISRILKDANKTVEDIPTSLMNAVVASGNVEALARFCNGYPVYQSEVVPFGSKHKVWRKKLSKDDAQWLDKIIADSDGLMADSYLIEDDHVSSNAWVATGKQFQIFI